MRPGLCGRGQAGVPGARPGSQAQNQLALADGAHLVALAGGEVDQARRGQGPLAGGGAHEQLAPQHEHERVLVHLMLLQNLALGQQQRDHAVGVLIGAQDLRMVRRDTQTIKLPDLHAPDCKRRPDVDDSRRDGANDAAAVLLSGSEVGAHAVV
jgi:hypothetical protein